MNRRSGLCQGSVLDHGVKKRVHLLGQMQEMQEMRLHKIEEKDDSMRKSECL